MSKWTQECDSECLNKVSRNLIVTLRSSLLSHVKVCGTRFNQAANIFSGVALSFALVRFHQHFVKRAKPSVRPKKKRRKEEEEKQTEVHTCFIGLSTGKKKTFFSTFRIRISFIDQV